MQYVSPCRVKRILYAICKSHPNAQNRAQLIRSLLWDWFFKHSQYAAQKRDKDYEETIFKTSNI